MDFMKSGTLVVEVLYLTAVHVRYSIDQLIRLNTGDKGVN